MSDVIAPPLGWITGDEARTRLGVSGRHLARLSSDLDPIVAQGSNDRRPRMYYDPSRVDALANDRVAKRRPASPLMRFVRRHPSIDTSPTLTKACRHSLRDDADPSRCSQCRGVSVERFEPRATVAIEDEARCVQPREVRPPIDESVDWVCAEEGVPS